MTHRFVRLSLGLATLGAAAALAGCGALQPGTDIGYGASTEAGTISGSAHGGPQVITGATIKLYTSGTVGVPAVNTQLAFNYGQAATLRATTTTSSTGGFNFVKSATNSDTIASTTNAWSCPTAGDPLVYLVATGGNPTGNGLATPTNSAIVLMAMLGRCSEIDSNTRIFLNEVTTVASVVAMQQFLNPNFTFNSTTYPSIGGSGSAMSVKGTYDAAATVPNMIDIRTGSARSITKTATTGTNVAGVSVTITPEIAKINTLANILSACVQTSTNTSAQCTALFSAAVPPTPLYTSQPTATFNTATDTLTALYYMLTNPTSGGAASNTATNLNALFALQSATPAFSPSIGTVPTDWTVGIRYEAAGQTCGATGSANGLPTKYLGYAYHVAIDKNGDVWAANGQASNTTSTSGLSQMSAAGLPLGCGAAGYVTTASPTYTAASLSPDSASIWLSGATAAAPNSLFRVNTSTLAVDTFPLSSTTPVFYNVLDGQGNVFYSVASKMYKIAAADATGAVGAGPYGVNIGGLVRSQPYFLALDGGGSIYNGYQGTTTATYMTTFQTYYASATAGTGAVGSDAVGYYKTNPASNTSTTVLTTPNPNNYGFAIGIDGKVWAGNGGCGTCNNQAQFAYFTPLASSTTGNGTIAAGAVTNYSPGFAGVTNPREVAVDGAGNVWTTNATANTGNFADAASPVYTCSTGSTTNPYTCWSLSEIAYDGSALSLTGSQSNAGATSTTSTGGFQKTNVALPYYGRSVAISPAGGVWIGSNSSAGTGITQLVGAAVPVVTPLAAAQGLFSTNGGNIVPKP